MQEWKRDPTRPNRKDYFTWNGVKCSMLSLSKIIAEIVCAHFHRRGGSLILVNRTVTFRIETWLLNEGKDLQRERGSGWDADNKLDLAKMLDLSRVTFALAKRYRRTFKTRCSAFPWKRTITGSNCQAINATPTNRTNRLWKVSQLRPVLCGTKRHQL